MMERLPLGMMGKAVGTEDGPCSEFIEEGWLSEDSQSLDIFAIWTRYILWECFGLEVDNRQLWKRNSFRGVSKHVGSQGSLFPAVLQPQHFFEELRAFV